MHNACVKHHVRGGLPAPIDIETISFFSIGRGDRGGLASVRNLSHAHVSWSNECLPICTSLAGVETNSYSLSHFRPLYASTYRLTFGQASRCAAESRTVVPSLLQRHRGQRKNAARMRTILLRVVISTLLSQRQTLRETEFFRNPAR